MRSAFPSRAVFAPYFGSLPNYTQLWALTAGQNIGIDWYLITDDEPGFELPPNVHLIRCTLHEFAKLLRNATATPIKLDHPYKLCDLRPTYSHLLQLTGRSFDFWGHCDLDVCWGNIDEQIAPKVYAEHDRVLTNGHLSFYRNSPEINDLFRGGVGALSWQTIATSQQAFGYDERHGMTRIFTERGFRQYEGAKKIADVEPNMLTPALLPPVTHQPRSWLLIWGGGVSRLTSQQGNLISEQFLYIHFQKRSVQIEKRTGSAHAYALTAGAFVPVGRFTDSLNNLAQNLPEPNVLSMRERLWWLRRRLAIRHNIGDGTRVSRKY